MMDLQTTAGGPDTKGVTGHPRALGQFPKPSFSFYQSNTAPDRLKLAQVMRVCTPALVDLELQNQCHAKELTPFHSNLSEAASWSKR